MKAFVVSRVLEFVDGARLRIPMELSTEKQLAEKAMLEDQAKLQALARAAVVLPNGQQIPFAAALAELGIKVVGNDAGETEVRTSELVVPQEQAPRIVLAR